MTGILKNAFLYIFALVCHLVKLVAISSICQWRKVRSALRHVPGMMSFFGSRVLEVIGPRFPRVPGTVPCEGVKHGR